MDGSYQLVIMVSLEAFRTAMTLAAEGETMASTSGLSMQKRMQLSELRRKVSELGVLGSIAPTSLAHIARLLSSKQG